MRLPLLLCVNAALIAQEAPSPDSDAAADARRFNGRARLSYGYDSNIVLLPEPEPLVTDEESAAVCADARATWRIVDRDERKLAVIGTAELDEFPQQDELQMLHYGLAANGMLALDSIDTGISAGLHRYVLDGDRAAMVYDGAITAARTNDRHVDIPSLTVEHVDYDENDDASGMTYSLQHRHWFLLADGNTDHRIEAGLSGGIHDAEDRASSYWFLGIGGGVAYRFGSGRRAGTWDTSARIDIERRRYQDPLAAGTIEEHQVLWAVSGACDRWMSDAFAIGAYARYSERTSNVTDRDYDRAQIGLRLTGAW